jgi:hypothetical protein
MIGRATSTKPRSFANAINPNIRQKYRSPITHNGAAAIELIRD